MLPSSRGKGFWHSSEGSAAVNVHMHVSGIVSGSWLEEKVLTGYISSVYQASTVGMMRGADVLLLSLSFALSNI